MTTRPKRRSYGRRLYWGLFLRVYCIFPSSPFGPRTQVSPTTLPFSSSLHLSPPVHVSRSREGTEDSLDSSPLTASLRVYPLRGRKTGHSVGGTFVPLPTYPLGLQTDRVSSLISSLVFRQFFLLKHGRLFPGYGPRPRHLTSGPGVVYRKQHRVSYVMSLDRTWTPHPSDLPSDVWTPYEL